MVAKVGGGMLKHIMWICLAGRVMNGYYYFFMLFKVFNIFYYFHRKENKLLIKISSSGN